MPSMNGSDGDVKEIPRRNYDVVRSRRRYFTMPISGTIQYRSLPSLLRDVANWLESEDIQDPEFDTLEVRQTLMDNDDSFYHATVYYRKETDKDV